MREGLLMELGLSFFISPPLHPLGFGAWLICVYRVKSGVFLVNVQFLTIFSALGLVFTCHVNAFLVSFFMFIISSE